MIENLNEPLHVPLISPSQNLSPRQLKQFGFALQFLLRSKKINNKNLFDNLFTVRTSQGKIIILLLYNL